MTNWTLNALEQAVLDAVRESGKEGMSSKDLTEKLGEWAPAAVARARRGLATRRLLRPGPKRDEVRRTSDGKMTVGKHTETWVVARERSGRAVPPAEGGERAAS